MARLIHPDGTETHVRPANGKKFTLEELQTLAAGGGVIQMLDLWVVQPQTGKKARVRMVLDEEGKLKGLAPNLVATTLVGGRLMEGDYIAGVALVMEPGDSM